MKTKKMSQIILAIFIAVTLMLGCFTITNANASAYTSGSYYQIPIDKQGGTGGNSLYIRYEIGIAVEENGPCITSIITPFKAGYNFAGYYTQTNGQGTCWINADGTLSSKASCKSISTLYAYWVAGNTINNNYYQIALEKQGGNGGDDLYCRYGIGLSTKVNGSCVTSIITPKKSGYTFNGYYTQPNGQGACWVNADGSLNSNASCTIVPTLYAYWTESAKNIKGNYYQITLDKQGGAAGNDLYCRYGIGLTTQFNGPCINSMTTPTKNGYIFGGYYTQPNGQGTCWINASGYLTSNASCLITDIVLYACWKIDVSSSYGTDYRNNVTVDVNGTGDYSSLTAALWCLGENPATITIKEGTYDITSEYDNFFSRSSWTSTAYWNQYSDANPAKTFSYGLYITNKTINAQGSVVISGTRPSEMRAVHANFSLIYIGVDVTLNNLNINGKNYFYVIHDDGCVDSSCTITYNNCQFSGSGNQNIIGGGVGVATTTIYNNCTFNEYGGSKYICARYHTRWRVGYPCNSTVKYINCTFYNSVSTNYIVGDTDGKYLTSIFENCNFMNGAVAYISNESGTAKIQVTEPIMQNTNITVKIVN